MSIQVTGAVMPAPTTPPKAGTPPTHSWGTSTLFERLAGVNQATAAYWVATVARPAHRLGHPVPMAGCPGCAYETAAVA